MERPKIGDILYDIDGDQFEVIHNTGDTYVLLWTSGDDFVYSIQDYDSFRYNYQYKKHE